MCRAVFNKFVRPYLIEIPIGEQGIGFDWLDLDEWLEEHKTRNECPGPSYGERLWDEIDRQDSVASRVINTLSQERNSSQVRAVQECDKSPHFRVAKKLSAMVQSQTSPTKPVGGMTPTPCRSRIFASMVV